MFKLKHSGIAAMLVAAFSHARFMAAASHAESPWQKKQPRGHSQGRLPKEFSAHNPAGTKITRMAASNALTMRGRVSR